MERCGCFFVKLFPSFFCKLQFPWVVATAFGWLHFDLPGYGFSWLVAAASRVLIACDNVGRSLRGSINSTLFGRGGDLAAPAEQPFPSSAATQ